MPVPGLESGEEDCSGLFGPGVGEVWAKAAAAPKANTAAVAGNVSNRSMGGLVNKVGVNVKGTPRFRCLVRHAFFASIRAYPPPSLDRAGHRERA